jgi:NAD-reducing hydrogenase large subunit
MNAAIAAVARDRLDGHTITDALLNEVEIAIRAFDPCLSCATHAMGAMPLAITVLGPDGAPRDHAWRDAGGALRREPPR